MKKVTTLLLAAIILASCGSILDKKVDIKTGKDDYAKIKEKYKDKYTKEELDALLNEMTTNVFTGGTKTYRELLDTIHAQKLEYDAAMTVYKKRIDSMKAILTMKIDTAAYVEDNYGEGIYAVKADVLNNTKTTILGIEGKFYIYDVFGKKMKTVYVKQTGNVKPGEEYTDGEPSPILSDDNETALKETPFSKIKWEWIPETIVFDDGTKITAPAKPGNPLADPFESED